ncbi:MAG: NACHT domain-containing protein, partial [Prochlorotrichaceae cyanobacterium]
SGFYDPHPEEVVRRFDQADDFFETVIRGEKSAQSRPIIVIGEPGAGKTTLLQKIATELPDALLPVWVSLADLQGYDLDQYLFGGTWWNQADKTLPPETGEEFRELFKTGQICLLLDGVDEMSVPAEQRGLSQLRVIYDQIKGWSDRIQVIMTCRVNVWEADPLFDKFEMYRNLQLEYPEQVEQYIDNFFSKPDLTVQSGEALKQELRDNDRVQDTVKNPLRLALLCHSWFQCGGKLPDTQAGLYEMFLKSFYDIKKEQFYVEPAEQEALHQALGELALEALDREQSNYRIDRSTAEKFLGHPEQKNPESFFYKALKLGLLNKIGYVAEDSSQECYAFIHPTFQEYLASLAIKDPSLLLKIDKINNYNINLPMLTLENIIILWIENTVSDVENNHIYIRFINRLNSLITDLDNQGLCFYSNYILLFLSKCLIIRPEHLQSKDILKRLIDYVFTDNDIREDLILKDPFFNEIMYKILSLKSDFLKSILEKRSTYIRTPDHKLLMSIMLVKIDPKNIYAELTLRDIMKCKSNSDKDVSRKINAAYFYDIYFGKDNQLSLQCVLEIISNPNISKSILNKCIVFLSKYLTDIELEKILKKYNFYQNNLVMLITRNIDSLQNYQDTNKFIDDCLNTVQQTFNKNNDLALYEFELCTQTILGIYNTKVAKVYSNIYLRREKQINSHKLELMICLVLYQYLDEINQYNVSVESILSTLSYLLFESEDTKSIDKFISHQIYFLHYSKSIKSKKAIQILISIFKKPYLSGYHVNPNMFLLANEILFLFVKKVSYSAFYEAWNTPVSSYFRKNAVTAIASTPQTQQLDRQFFNLQNQLTPTDTTYPLCLNLSSLQNLNDRSELCQELANLSYEAIDPNFDTLEIPENVQDPAQLKAKLLKLRKHLNVQNLALILHNSDPTPELLAIFNVLKSSFSIAWVTDHPHPYRSFLPTAENLSQLIQTWLMELDCNT